MYADNENENIMQVMGNRNLDEMRQQTLDALKVVQSFEAKPARSARVQELLAQKAHTRQLNSTVSNPRSLNLTDSLARPPPEVARPARRILQPVKEIASPEKRFASSPKKVSSLQTSPTHSPLREKSGRVHEASPVKHSFAKRFKPAPLTTAPEQSLGAMRPASVRNSASSANSQGQIHAQAHPMRSLAGQDASFSRTSTQGASQNFRRGPLVSSFRSVSRLLQPTAASAAKMRPVRAAMAPTRTDRLPQVDSRSRKESSMGSRPATTASTPRSSVFPTKNLNSSGSAPSKNTIMPSLSTKHHPLRTGGLSQLNTAQNKTFESPHNRTSATLKITKPTATIDSSVPAVTKAPASTTSLAGPSLQPSKSLLSSVLTKTHNDKQPTDQSKPGQIVAPETPSTSRTAASQSVSSAPRLLGPTESPTTTSSPIRVTPNSSVSEHSSGSFHSFDFTNFSFEAEWAKTPELRKKVLEQKNDDTVQLFGHMPPINLESIFGAEMQRQHR